MKVRKSTESDFNRIMQIYAYARDFMAKNGNPNQWGPTNWPPEELSNNIEPTYFDITDGDWLGDSSYGVVHRIAGDGSKKGIGTFCINWAFEQCGHLRMDTHGDNKVMQSLLTKLGFIHCGTIYVEEDDYPRLAYEKWNKSV